MLLHAKNILYAQIDWLDSIVHEVWDRSIDVMCARVRGSESSISVVNHRFTLGCLELM